MVESPLKQAAGVAYRLWNKQAFSGDQGASRADELSVPSCCIYFVDFEPIPYQVAEAARHIPCPVISIYVQNWDDDNTPWPAPGLYKGDAPFKGLAAETLKRFQQAIPEIEKAENFAIAHRALAGYSLAGLFAAWAFLNSQTFGSVASMSGSLWYPGWIDYLNGLAKDPPCLKGRFAFLSIGSKERRALPDILHTVQDNTLFTAEKLEAWGAQVDYKIGPGAHTDHGLERLEQGFHALEQYMRTLR